MRAAVFLVSLFISLISLAQDAYTGLAFDNVFNAGNALYNPSSIVDSRFRVSFATNSDASSWSNFYSRRYLIYDLGAKFDKHSVPGIYKSFRNIDLINFKYELSHDRAVGYALRIRNMSMVKGIPQTWSENLTKDFQGNTVGKAESLAGMMYSNTWFTEHVFTYAQTLFDKNETAMKVGGSLKILNGLSADYYRFNGGTATFTDPNNGNVSLSDVSVSYGTNFKSNQSSYKNFGLSFDFGVTYEYRPEFKKQFYDMDGEKDLIRYDINKYKWKITASLLDLGWIRFYKDTLQKDFTAASAATNATNLFNPLTGLYKPINTLNGIFQPVGTIAEEQPEKFRMNMPTTINVGGDYFWKNDFYLSYNMTVPIGYGKDPNHIKAYFVHTVTPRYETNNWGILLPISQTGNGKITGGIAGRFLFHGWSAYLGSNNAAFLYGKKSSLSRNFFIGASYQIPYKIPKDRDDDKISDLKDYCPDDKGPLEYNGCPDTDGDGILDKDDRCIYDMGPSSTKGCPDADGDGIVDMNDMCPNDKGLGIHYGCPDKDKDGVIDAADRCPDVPGIELNNGCPFENPGCCMDNDGDGVSNKVDKCPEIAGSVYNNGCPIDSSNINKVNLQDQKEIKDPNHTSQQVKEAELKDIRASLITSKEQLNELGKDKNIILDYNVYFDVDEFTLREPDAVDFIEEFKRIKSVENISFIVIGYTDRDGSLDYNLILSKRRAEMVKRKLEDLGFKERDIKIYYYGESKSLHKGSYTKEMKQEDRKVEIRVIQN